MRDNNKGFTLVELIATIVLLALVASIGTYSITSIVKKSKEENYELLKNNIRSAADTYYQECKYAKNNATKCTKSGSGYSISLSELVQYGYLVGNDKKDDGSYAIVNPITNKEIGDCRIEVEYDEEDKKIIVKNLTIQTGELKCPKYIDKDDGGL